MLPPASWAASATLWPTPPIDGIIVAILDVRIRGDRSANLDLLRGEKSQERSMATDPKTTIDGELSLPAGFCLGGVDGVDIADGRRTLLPLNDPSSAPHTCHN
jgi:hypothetical protein